MDPMVNSIHTFFWVDVLGSSNPNIHILGLKFRCFYGANAETKKQTSIYKVICLKHHPGFMIWGGSIPLVTWKSAGSIRRIGDPDAMHYPHPKNGRFRPRFRFVYVEKASPSFVDPILITLPKLNIAPENGPPLKESSLPTIHFQVLG